MDIQGASSAARLLMMQQASAAGRGEEPFKGQNLPGGDQFLPRVIAFRGEDGAGAGPPKLASDTMNALIAFQIEAPAPQDMARSMIDNLDQNGDGALSLDEISQSLGQRGVSGDLEKLFGQLDTDADGSLTAEELTAALAQREADGPHMMRLEVPPPQDMAKSTLTAFDADGDGALTLDDLVQSLQRDDEELKKIFSDLDSDGDGKITIKELTAAFENEGQTVEA